MAEQWKVTVLGVRGAIPMPAAEFLRYGGHTSCITVDCGEELVVLDAGSGLSQLNPAPRPDGKARLDILLSHLHLDHVMGLFGCRQLYDPEAEIHLYGEARAGVSLRTQLAPGTEGFVGSERAARGWAGGSLPTGRPGGPARRDGAYFAGEPPQSESPLPFGGRE